MANRYFNKQVTESRKPLLAGGFLKKGLKLVSKGVKERNAVSSKMFDKARELRKKKSKSILDVTPRKIIKQVVKDSKNIVKNKTLVTGTIAGSVNEVVKNEKKKKNYKRDFLPEWEKKGSK